MLEWKAIESDLVPLEAVPAENSVTGERIYIGRSTLNNNYMVGRIQSADGRLCLGIDVVQPNEILVVQNGAMDEIEWIRWEKRRMELLDLNDDCLMEIASKLLAVDLTTLARTCQRLRNTAKMVIKTNPARQELDLNTNTFNNDTLKSYLMCFGDMVRQVTLSSCPEKYIEELLAKYCAETLHTIVVEDSENSSLEYSLTMSPTLVASLANLRKLNVKYCGMDDEMSGNG